MVLGSLLLITLAISILFAWAVARVDIVERIVADRKLFLTTMVFLYVVVLGYVSSIITLDIAFLILLGVGIPTYLLAPILIKHNLKGTANSELQRIVDEVALKLRSAPPDAIVYHGQPNALAFGNLLKKYVAVSDSLIELLDTEELKAVIAHEIAHHKNWDIPLSLGLGLLPQILVIVSLGALNSARNSPLSDDPMYVASRVFVGLFGFFLMSLATPAVLLTLAFNRIREYYADLTAARTFGKSKLQKALLKVDGFYSGTESKLSLERPIKMLFFYALAGRFTLEGLYRFREEALSTHPPIPKRLKFLERFDKLL